MILGFDNIAESAETTAAIASSESAPTRTADQVLEPHLGEFWEASGCAAEHLIVTAARLPLGRYVPHQVSPVAGALALHPSQRWLAVYTAAAIYVYEIDRSTAELKGLVWTRALSAGIAGLYRPIDFHPSGLFIAFVHGSAETGASNAGFSVHRFEPATGAIGGRLSNPAQISTSINGRAVRFGGDGGDKIAVAVNTTFQLHPFNAATAVISNRVTLTSFGGVGTINDVAVTPTVASKYLAIASGGSSPYIALQHFPTNAAAANPSPTPGASVTCFEVLADNRGILLAVNGTPKWLRLQRIASAQTAWSAALALPWAGGIPAALPSAIALDPSRRLLAAAGSGLAAQPFGFETIGSVQGLAFGDGRWVAVGDDGREAGSQVPVIAVSRDGVNWQRRFIGTGAITLRTIAHNGLAAGAGGLWVAAGDSATQLWTSPDAIVWTERTVAFSGTVLAVLHGGGTWVALNNASPPSWWHSTDAVNWTSGGSTGSTGALKSAVYGGGFFAFTTASGRVSRSADGLAWSHANPTANSITAIAYNGAGRFGIVTAAGELYRSDDLVNWTSVETGLGTLCLIAGLGDHWLVGRNNASVLELRYQAANLAGTTTAIAASGHAATPPAAAFARASPVTGEVNWALFGDATAAAIGVLITATSRTPTLAADLRPRLPWGRMEKALLSPGNASSVVIGSDGWAWADAAGAPAIAAYAIETAPELPQTITDLALIQTNLSEGATVRVQTAEDPAFAAVVGDSGELLAFDPALGDDELERVRRPVLLLGLDLAPALYLKIAIKDPANADGRVRVARLYAGQGWRPVRNYQVGLRWPTLDYADALQPYGGRQHLRTRALARVVELQSGLLESADAAILRELLAKGRRAEILTIWGEESDRADAVRRGFWALPAEVLAPVRAAPLLDQFTCRLVEIVV